MKEIKVAVVGCSGVGKSATTTQFVQHFFVEESNFTMEEKYRKQLKLDEEEVFLHITDTAGTTNRFTASRDQMYRSQDGFVLIYSIISRRSFEAVEAYRDAILTARSEQDTPMVLVGNMSDLKHMREVNTKEGEDLAVAWGIPFLETTAKNLESCTELFMQVAGRTHLSEIPRQIDEMKKQSLKLKWWSVGQKKKMKKNMGALKSQQNSREIRFQLRGLEAELTKIEHNFRPLSAPQVPASTLSEDMQALWLDHDTADVTVVVDSLPFYCHLAVLWVRAPGLFSQLPVVRGANYNMPQRLCASSAAFSVIARFIYTGELPLNLHPQLGPAIRAAAKCFGMDDFVQRLSNWPAQPFVPCPLEWKLSGLLRSNHSGANLSVRCGDKVFHLHRCIVQSRMSRFHQFYGNGAVVTVEDMDPHTLAALVEYLYNDDIPSNSTIKVLTELIRVAARSKLPRLSALAEHRLIDDHLTDKPTGEVIENLYEIYQCGVLTSYGSPSCGSPFLGKFVENVSVSPEVWQKFREGVRYKQAVPQNLRASLMVRQEEMNMFLQHKGHLEKQVQSSKAKLRALYSE